MTTLFETEQAAKAALEAAIARGVMQNGLVYRDTLSLREKGLTRFVAEGYRGSHSWKL